MTYTNEELVQPISAAFRHLGSCWSTSTADRGRPRAGRLLFGYCPEGTNRVRAIAILIHNAAQISRTEWDNPRNARKNTRVMLDEAHWLVFQISDIWEFADKN